jgi:hypothetical protein
MNLMKSPSGKLFIVLYYVFLFTADFFLTVFIIGKTGSILAGLVIGFVLSVGIGVWGGELEFREHMKTKYGKSFNKRRTEEPKKIVDFPE